jgi:hypothetical protein
MNMSHDTGLNERSVGTHVGTNLHILELIIMPEGIR